MNQYYKGNKIVSVSLYYDFIAGIHVWLNMYLKYSLHATQLCERGVKRGTQGSLGKGGGEGEGRGSIPNSIGSLYHLFNEGDKLAEKLI